jgi:zinc transport system ATP-binding protein
MAAQNKPIIEVRDLWFSYNGRPILSGVNFDVLKNDFIALIGPNGGGKTTLVKLILGLLTPQKGSVRVFGKPPNRSGHSIGYVPQDVHINGSFPISVLDVVMMGRQGPGKRIFRYSRRDKEAARTALEMMEIWEHRSNRIGDLSGGQQQRALIARAMVSEPEILVLDEPTASIDAKGQTSLYALLKALNEGIAIMVVTHDLMVVSQHIKSVVCVNRNVHYHDSGEVTADMMEMAYACPVELVAHGLPHRVLGEHQDE